MADCFIVRRQNIKYEYGENIFDFQTFKSVLSNVRPPVINGTIKWLENGFTVTDTSGSGAYTNCKSSVKTPSVTVKPNTFYELSYDLSGSVIYNYQSLEYPFDANAYIRYDAQLGRLLFRTPHKNNISVRFDAGKGQSCTYTNIQMREVLNIY